MPGSPLIDERTYGDLVSQVETLAAQLTAGEVEAAAEALTGAVLDQDVLDGGAAVATAGTIVDAFLAERIAQIQGLGPVRVRGWQPAPEDAPNSSDAGSALVRIFGRMAELVIARLNQVPDRNFLAFLDLIGTRLEPPQTARVPLTFNLAAGSTVEALVPARTPVAATPLEGDTAPVLFETERSLVVTRSQLVAVTSREPGRDLWADHTAVATGQAAGSFQPFRGDPGRPIEHRLHVDHPFLGLAETKTVDLQIGPADKSLPWLTAVTWSFWNGSAFQPVTPAISYRTARGSGAPYWLARFANVPGIAASPVNGRDGFWLHGRLEPPLARGEVVPAGAESELRRRGLPAAAAFTESEGRYEAVDLAAPFYPFGSLPPLRAFYLSAGAGFTKPGSSIEIAVALDAELPPEPSAGLTVTWEYWQGTAWQALAAAVFTPAAPPEAGEEAGPFLVDGTLRFPRPDDWAGSLVEGTDGFWLRARVTHGSFGSPPSDRPPRVLSLTLGDAWQLPRVDSVELGVTLNRRAADQRRVPERGFSDQAPVDLSKDFFPFGEKPKVGGASYLASEEAFAKPGSSVDLHVALTNPADANGTPLPAASTTVMLTWEFWDGRAWRFLGNTGPGATEADQKHNTRYHFHDSSNGFLAAPEGEAIVHFIVPPSLAPATVNGETRRFVRARIAKGNYGVEAKYSPVLIQGVPQRDEHSLPVFELVPATFRPPSLSSLLLGYRHHPRKQAPRRALTENDFTFADVTAAAALPALTFTPFVPTADLRPTVYLGFERPGDALGFANRAAALFLLVSEALFDPAVEQGSVTDEASVVWEYWNGEGWERLGIRDETRGFTSRGLVTFIGPPDFRASADFGRTAFWLRARWERGEYAVEPRLDRILTNTTWAVHAQTIAREVLGSSRGERAQVFRTLRTPVLDGQRLEVIEPELPSAPDLAALAAEEGEDAVREVPDAAGRATGIRVRWHEVPDFYGSGPRSRHYTLDRLTGEVRFGDGRRGLVPPAGRNNVVLASYRSGGGLAGNRPAGNVTQLRVTVPYVDSVSQHEPAAGGAAAESPSALVVRGPRTLRHRDRAVAPADFEDLAVQASTEVARARCIAALGGGADAGQVGLIVVPRSGAAKPVPSLELLDRVESYLLARVSPALDLWVVGPDWLEVTVEAEVAPGTLEAAADVQTAVVERLATFLHPLTGGPGGEGWAFGRKPYRSDLFALIEGTPGVDHVLRLQVSEVPREGGARAKRFLVYSGDHQITLTGNTDESAPDGSLS